jgi:hypothetical protein
MSFIWILHACYGELLSPQRRLFQIPSDWSAYECEQENAVKGLVELIALFDKDTYFFINSWTWGYKDVLKGIARAFQCQVGKPLFQLYMRFGNHLFIHFLPLRRVFNYCHDAYMRSHLHAAASYVTPLSFLPLHSWFRFTDMSTLPDTC